MRASGTAQDHPRRLCILASLARSRPARDCFVYTVNDVSVKLSFLSTAIDCGAGRGTGSVASGIASAAQQCIIVMRRRRVSRDRRPADVAPLHNQLIDGKWLRCNQQEAQLPQR